MVYILVEVSIWIIENKRVGENNKSLRLGRDKGIPSSLLWESRMTSSFRSEDISQGWHALTES